MANHKDPKKTKKPARDKKRPDGELDESELEQLSGGSSVAAGVNAMGVGTQKSGGSPMIGGISSLPED